MAFDKTQPVASSYANKLYGTIRTKNTGIESAVDNEHDFTTGGTQTGHHTQGSARCFWQATAPATRIDGTSFTSADLGSIWIDSDDNKIYILTATTPTWTNISAELFATFLAAARVFGSTLGVTGDFAVNTNKFKVTATTGKTEIAGDGTIAGNAAVTGTLGVTGIATLGDQSGLASSAAPTADAQIANKKYVDDQIAAAVPDDNAFGSWTSKNNNIVYQAVSDGFVCAYGAAPSTVRGYTDSSNPPGTQRLLSASGTSAQSITMPVKKNDYWKVTGASTVYWLPIGA